ncbi:HAAS signaling domain-containing protein [Paenibacillus gansuensis]|uniref:DUF1700 domain-containing protein n=1 Tax=Paenibacillus gansuensis TaxID=306542 RepID=A0ABW5PFE5_9BACL
MRRELFLSQLESSLAGVPDVLRREWMFDYEEHFRIAELEGRPESEVADELGDPQMIAKELLMSYRVTQAEENSSITNVMRAVTAAVSLGFVNLLFVLAPFIGVCAIIVSLWVVGAACSLSGLVFAGAGVFRGGGSMLQGIFVGLTLSSLGVLIFYGMAAVTKVFLAWTIRYIRFNVKIVKE